MHPEERIGITYILDTYLWQGKKLFKWYDFFIWASLFYQSYILFKYIDLGKIHYVLSFLGHGLFFVSLDQFQKPHLSLLYNRGHIATVE